MSGDAGSPSRPGIVLCGATGRTGNAVAHALVARADVHLAAVVAPSVATTPSRALPVGVAAFATLAEALDAPVAEGAVVVDLTHAEPAVAHLHLALQHRRHVVLGATGLDSTELGALAAGFADAGLGLFEVPNFSIGVALMQRCVELLAPHFPDAEVVEVHHDGKRDSPSGTAAHTARLIARARDAAGAVPGPGAASAGAGGARGESIDGVPVHALRLPGATAHQDVVFGAPGELVTVRHDAIDRSCYAHGVALAVRRVHEMRGLVTGLETVL